MDGELQLAGHIPVSGNFINWGKLTTDGHPIFDGGVAQNLTLAYLAWFDNVAAAVGTF